MSRFYFVNEDGKKTVRSVGGNLTVAIQDAHLYFGQYCDASKPLLPDGWKIVEGDI